MSLTAVILLLIAAASHAGWNLIGKQRSPTPGSFMLANTASMIILAVPVLLLYSRQLLQIPGSVWWALVATGAFQALYFAALAGAYARGDMSVVYPLARSSPIIIVTVVSTFLGRGKDIGWGCVAGIVLVVAGCFILPMRRFGDFKIRNYLNLCCLLALVAAIGTAGYTIIDDIALRSLRSLTDRGFGVVNAALVYILAETVTTSVWLGLYLAFRQSDRVQVMEAIRTQKVQAMLMGAGISLAYVLVLISFSYVRDVSYAAAFRQVSILLGVAIAAVHMKEPMPAPRWTGALVIFAGLVLVAIG